MLSLSDCTLLLFRVAQTKPVLALHKMTVSYQVAIGQAYAANPRGTHLLPTSLHPSFVAQALFSFLLLILFFQISNMTTGRKLAVQENEDSLPSPNTDSISQDVHLNQVAWFEGWGTIMLDGNFIIKLVTSIYELTQHRETCSEKQKQKKL